MMISDTAITAVANVPFSQQTAGIQVKLGSICRCGEATAPEFGQIEAVVMVDDIYIGSIELGAVHMLSVDGRHGSSRDQIACMACCLGRPQITTVAKSA